MQPHTSLLSTCISFSSTSLISSFVTLASSFTCICASTSTSASASASASVATNKISATAIVIASANAPARLITTTTTTTTTTTATTHTISVSSFFPIAITTSRPSFLRIPFSSSFRYYHHRRYLYLNPFKRFNIFSSAANFTTRSFVTFTQKQSQSEPPIMHHLPLQISIVVAATLKDGIGLNHSIPWKIPSDMARFKKITSSIDSQEENSTTPTTTTTTKYNAVIMGRVTWQSIPDKFKPLSNRLNIIISSTMEQIDHPMVHVCKSLEDAIAFLNLPEQRSQIHEIFVIGGAKLYNEAVLLPECKTIYYTQILDDIECDTFIDPIDKRMFRITEIGKPQQEGNVSYQFLTYQRITDSSLFPTLNTFSSPVLQHEECQYLALIDRILKHGVRKDDRTNTGTISLFGAQMRFSLDKSFPLLTTKRVFWKGVVEELLWFVAGSTDGQLLLDKGIKIWQGNGSRQFLDKLGLTDRRENDLGPVYGFQWRHFGAKYVDCKTDYTGQGVDQLANIINKIKENPNDRRLVMSAWNPCDIPQMALPPCHVMAQFYVVDNTLSCSMYQRSADMGLGVPFNIASYSLLTCMIAHITNLTPKDFVYTLGDAHIYSNHVEPLKEQLKRTPRPFPTLQFRTDRQIESIDDFTSSDILLSNYQPHDSIKMEMAV